MHYIDQTRIVSVELRCHPATSRTSQGTHMRLLSILLLTTTLAAAENLLPDNLFGTWVVNEKALSKEQKQAAESAARIEGFGITFTLRTARVVFAQDEMITGMWRLDDATPTTATLVIQPKGADERRYKLTLAKQQLTVAECPGQLPLRNSR